MGCFEGQSSKCGGAALPSLSELWPDRPPLGGKVPTGSVGNGNSAGLGSLKPPQGFQGVCSLSVRTMFSRGDKGLSSRMLPAGRANPIRLAMSPCALCAPRDSGEGRRAGQRQGRDSGVLLRPPGIRVCPWPRSPERSLEAQVGARGAVSKVTPCLGFIYLKSDLLRPRRR